MTVELYSKMNMWYVQRYYAAVGYRKST